MSHSRNLHRMRSMWREGKGKGKGKSMLKKTENVMLKLEVIICAFSNG